VTPPTARCTDRDEVAIIGDCPRIYITALATPEDPFLVLHPIWHGHNYSHYQVKFVLAAGIATETKRKNHRPAVEFSLGMHGVENSGRNLN
jgi:hypothetical protein